MKSISISLSGHYAQGTTTLATCFKATLANGTVIAATSLDRDLVIDGVTYAAAQGYNASDIDSSAELNTDNLELAGVLSSADITERDIHAGLWDYAAVEIFEINYADLTMGKNILRSGRIGDVRTGRSQFFAELRGLMQAYTKTICELRGPSCRADLGDARCTVDLTGMTFAGVVASVSEDNRTIGMGLANAANYFTYGKITFRSGSNVGLSMEIKTHAVGSVTLQLPMPHPILVDDTFDIVAGCDKTLATCRDRFDNVVNFRGEPWLPGADKVMQVGGRESLASTSVVVPTTPPTDGGQGPGTTPDPWIPGGGTSTGGTGVIDYFGDSTIKGWDATIGDGTVVATPAPAAMQTAMGAGWTVNNLGVHGANTTELLAGTDGHAQSFAARVAATAADWLIVNDCLNDAKTTTVATYSANLQQMVVIANAASKTLLFETPNPAADIPALPDFVAAMIAVADDNGLRVIDQYAYLNAYMASHGMTQGDLCPDGLHPSQATYILKGQFAAAKFREYFPTAGGSTGADNAAAMVGPDRAQFGATPTFFDDFDGTQLSNRWNRGLWYRAGVPNGTLRVNGGCLEMCTQPDSMFTGGNDTGYCVVDTDPDSTVGGNGFKQKYGVFQAECKLPIGRGYWPSFWLFGHPNNHRPEVDGFEAYPGGASDWSDGSTAPHPMRADVTLHPLDDPGGYQAPTANFAISNGLDLSADFHKYTIEWDESYMRFYFDGNLVNTVTNSDTMAYFAQFQLYLLLGFGINYDTAGGGPSSNPAVSPTGFGSDPTNVPANVFRIRHVAAWQWTKYGG